MNQRSSAEAMRLFTVIAIMFGCAACSHDAPADSSINDALTRLEHRTNIDCFVIVEDPESNRYVQFSCDHTGRHIFDFPVQTVSLEYKPECEVLRYDILVAELPDEGAMVNVLLSKSEVERLVQLLKRRNLAYKVERLAGHCGDQKIKEYLEAIKGDFPKASEGKAFVREVFEQVYLLAAPDEFIISEN